jgi:hypothetical protein
MRFLALALLLAAQIPDAQAKGRSGALWDSWYTVSAGGARAGYYNDSAEIKEGKVFFKNRFWKQEEGFINEEQLGLVSEDSADLRPVFFNFRSVYRNSETIIDGTVKEGKLLVKVRKNGQEQPLIQRSLPKNVIFASMFPLLLGKKIAGTPVGKTIGFETILEDKPETGYAPVSGTFRLEKPDEFASRTKTVRVVVDYNANKSVWYVEPSGMPVLIESPALQQKVQKVPRAEAEKFLSAQGAAPGGSNPRADGAVDSE